MTKEHFIPVKLVLTSDARQFQSAFASLDSGASTSQKRFKTAFGHIERDGTSATRALTRDFNQFDSASARAARNAESHYSRAFQSIKSKASGLGGSIGGMLGGAATVAGGNLISSALGKIGGAMMSGIETGIEYNKLIETSMVSFETLTGSVDMARKHLADLQKFSASTPFELPGLIKSSQLMQGMGFKAKEIIPMLTGVGEAMSAMGRNSEEEIQRVTLQLGQMALKGKVSGDEMTDLAVNGFPAWELLAKAIGKTTAETQKLASEGRLKGRESAIAITQQAELKYRGQMGRMAGTLAGLESNFNDTLRQRLGEGSRGVTDFLKKFYADAGAGMGTAAAENFVKTFNDGVVSFTKDLDPVLKGIADGTYFTAGTRAMKAADKTMRVVEKGTGVNYGKLAPELIEGTLGDPSKMSDPIDRAVFGALRRALNFVGDWAEDKGAETGTRFGAGMEPGTRKALESRSPSRVYTRIGLDVAKGFADGLLGGTGQFVNPAMDGMLKSSKKNRRLPLPDRADRALDDLMKREPAFIPKLKEIADKLQTKPEWLLQLMALETAGTFSPRITNKQGYTGLIQFGAEARKDLGVSQRELQGMTATRQLDEVLKYFTSNKGKRALDSLTQLYSIVALPAIKNLPDTAIVASTTYKRKRFANNPAWNSDGDNVITKGELGVVAGRAMRLEDAMEALGRVRESSAALLSSATMLEKASVSIQQAASALNLPKASLPGVLVAPPTISKPPVSLTITSAKDAAPVLERATEKLPIFKRELDKLVPMFTEFPSAMAPVARTLDQGGVAYDRFGQRIEDATTIIGEATEKGGEGLSRFGQLIKATFDRGFDQLLSGDFKGLGGTLKGFGREFASQSIKSLLFGGGQGGSGGFNVGGFSIPGLGPGGTATFSGAPIGASSSGGSFGGVLGNGSGLLSKIPGIGKLISGGGLLGKLGLGAAGKAAFVEGALTSAFGPATAVAGSAGAGGAAGGGLLSGLGPLLTNPVTAIVAGSIAGGFLLYKLFSGRDLKKLRSTIQGEYAVDVKDKNILKEIKELGKQSFGKGWDKKMLETIRLEPAKETIANYAKATGQKGNGKLISAAEYGDPFSAVNRFERREFGGPVLAGVPYLVGERRPEVFVPDRSGQIVPSVEQYQGNGRSAGSAETGAMQVQINQLAAAVTGLMAVVSRFQAVTPGQVLLAGAAERPDVVPNNILSHQRQNPNFTRQFTQTQFAGQ